MEFIFLPLGILIGYGLFEIGSYLFARARLNLWRFPIMPGEQSAMVILLTSFFMLGMLTGCNEMTDWPSDKSFNDQVEDNRCMNHGDWRETPYCDAVQKGRNS